MSLAVSVIEPGNGKFKTFLVILSVIVMGITLGAGLWPFSFHVKNQAWWKPEQAGLYFGNTGMALSDGKFAGRATVATGCSIELWIEPRLAWDSSTILSFYEPGITPRIQVRQSGDDLVYTTSDGPEGQNKKRNVFVDRVFRKGERILVTLTSSDDTLNLYVNGVLKKSVKNMQMRAADFSGTLIVANAPYGNLSWTGTFRGLALYDRALRAEEISEDYNLWQHDRELQARKAAQAYSLYLFSEQSGDRLHNVGRAGPDLIIPKSYFIIQPDLLVPFWKEYRPSSEYARDLAINVFGLVPLGVCFAALFAWLIGIRRSLLYTTVLGFCVSLTIEVLQAFIPTRFSGTTDLITNTSGTALGAWLYLNTYSQVWLKRWGIVRAQ
jgi:VanZ family protein